MSREDRVQREKDRNICLTVKGRLKKERNIGPERERDRQRERARDAEKAKELKDRDERWVTRNGSLVTGDR